MYEHGNIHMLDCILIKKSGLKRYIASYRDTSCKHMTYFLLNMQKFTIINFKIPFVNQTHGFRISLFVGEIFMFVRK